MVCAQHSSGHAPSKQSQRVIRNHYVVPVIERDGERLDTLPSPGQVVDALTRLRIAAPSDRFEELASWRQGSQVSEAQL